MKCLQTLVEIKTKGERTIKQEHGPPSSSTRIKSASSAVAGLQGEDQDEAHCALEDRPSESQRFFRRNFV